MPAASVFWFIIIFRAVKVNEKQIIIIIRQDKTHKKPNFKNMMMKTPNSTFQICGSTYN